MIPFGRWALPRFRACFPGLILLLAGVAQSFGFALNGYTWPGGTQILMHLQLNSRAAVPLQDGSNSWDDAAADALAIWNQYAETVQFVRVAPGRTGDGDGVNSVFFSKNVYGEAWAGGTLAVTLSYSSGPDSYVFTETDVIFNDNLKWNSYRGPLQGGGPTGTYDVHRVALHEFGHVVGLDHPDQHGQSVVAVMNSIISDLDHLADDDIAGVRSLYGKARLTAYLGANFTYQVASSTSGATYSASGLPPGLTIDSSSGLISGIPTISGTYSVIVTVQSSAGTSKIPLQITVTAPGSNSNPGGLLKKLDLSVYRLVADPYRSRVYASLVVGNSIAVIDTVSLSVIKTIPVGAGPLGLTESADGSRLWVANGSSATPTISVIDLNSLTTLPSIPVLAAPSAIAEGVDNRLYVTPNTQGTGIMQVDAVTGQAQGTFGGFEVYYGGFLQISPDRKTLYFANRGLGPSTAARYDVSTATPVLLQQANVGSNGEDLKLSHDGRLLIYPNGSGNGTPSYATYLIPSTDLRGVLGVLPTGAYPGPVAFSGDDLVLYQHAQAQSTIDIWDPKTAALLGTIKRPSSSNDAGQARDIAVDNSGGKLFLATGYYSFPGELQVFDTGRANVIPPAPVAARSLANVSTRLRVQAGEGALIGGFIITGSASKTVVIRALGPSLPLAGSLADPTLAIYDSTGALVAADDNWNSDRAHVLKTGLAPKDEHEAVVVVSLPAGAYTAVVRGTGDTPTGIGLVELYDIDSNHSRMANIATRGVVDAGDNVMIGGFIIAGEQPTKIIVRGIGPSLAASGVANPLADPVLELHDGNGALITENDDWRSLQEDAINATGIPPSDEKESAIVATLSPGNYTAIVRGKGEQPGVGLVEIYNLDAN
ncbi:MAG TPA: matrixin family metalloprotease [Chthoniobacterales bacterium]|nr:matrixin family metalloprotease [Chthoniobacterales bacterium]